MVNATSETRAFLNGRARMLARQLSEKFPSAPNDSVRQITISMCKDEYDDTRKCMEALGMWLGYCERMNLPVDHNHNYWD